jgi:putative phosphoesterase
MKIAIISDIHGNIYGLKKVLSDLPKIDKIICAGDITGFYPFVNEVIKEIKNKNVISVKGNHDEYLIDGKAPKDKNIDIKNSVEQMKRIISIKNLDYVKSLPESLNLDIDGNKVLVVHGSPWNHLEGRIYPDFADFDNFLKVDADVIILGHTHRPFIKRIGNKIIINPGSCGQPRDYNLASYILWDTKKNVLENKRVFFDINKFKEEALKRGTDKKLLEVFKRIDKQ